MNKGGFFKRTVRDVPLHGKTVLVRADYNVPLTKDGEIDDDFRILSSLPTIKYLIEQDCKVIICSHLGRPGGKVNDEHSLEPIALHLAKLLGQPVQFVPECIGDQVKQKAKKLRISEVLLLENVRFHKGEETNDEQFARSLAEGTMAEYFVQDGFGVVHRAHASTEAITHFLPSVAGLLLEKEYAAIRHTIDDPSHPLVAVFGGAKISDKIAVIEKFVTIADKIIIGGAMANTFFKFHGYEIGKSVYEAGLEGVVQKIYDAAEIKVGKDNVDEFIVLPTDVAVALSIGPSERRISVSVDEVAFDEYILDMGPESITAAVDAISQAKSVFWNGTMGYAELPHFAHGSARIALALASNSDITSIIGGGDTADFVLKWDAAGGESFTHVSTGGGASLDLMAGLPMPGIKALLDA